MFKSNQRIKSALLNNSMHMFICLNSLNIEFERLIYISGTIQISKIKQFKKKN